MQAGRILRGAVSCVATALIGALVAGVVFGKWVALGGAIGAIAGLVTAIARPNRRESVKEDPDNELIEDPNFSGVKGNIYHRRDH